MNDKAFSDHKMLVETMVFYKNVTKFMEYEKRENSPFTVTELFFIFYLEDKRSATYYQLSQDLPYTSSYISKTIKKMEEKGIVVRESVANKKVIKLSSLTEDALQRRPGGKEDFLDFLSENDLSREEIKSFFLTMIKFSKVLSDRCNI